MRIQIRQGRSVIDGNPWWLTRQPAPEMLQTDETLQSAERASSFAITHCIQTLSSAPRARLPLFARPIPLTRMPKPLDLITGSRSEARSFPLHSAGPLVRAAFADAIPRSCLA